MGKIFSKKAKSDVFDSLPNIILEEDKLQKKKQIEKNNEHILTRKLEIIKRINDIDNKLKQHLKSIDFIKEEIMIELYIDKKAKLTWSEQELKNQEEKVRECRRKIEEIEHDVDKNQRRKRDLLDSIQFICAEIPVSG